MEKKHRKSAIKGFEHEEYDEKADCPVPYIACVCRGASVPKKLSDEGAGFRMRCTNDRCHLASSYFLHKKCSDKLEETLLKILGNEGSARGWTCAQLRSNLWEKKGQSLVGRILRCRCGMGVMSVDVDFYKKQMDDERKQKALVDPPQLKPKKATKKNKLPSVNYNSVRPVAIELLQSDFIPPSRIAERQPQAQQPPPPPPPPPILMAPPQQRRQRWGGGGGATLLAAERTSPPQLCVSRQESPVVTAAAAAVVVVTNNNTLKNHISPEQKHLDNERKQRTTLVDPHRLNSKKVPKKTKPSSANYNGVRLELLQNDSVTSNRISERKARTQSPPLPPPPSSTTTTTRRQHFSGGGTGGGGGVGVGATLMAGGERTSAQVVASREETTATTTAASVVAAKLKHSPEQPRSFYSLFDPRSHGFYLGELILGEFYLPRLLQPSA